MKILLLLLTLLLSMWVYAADGDSFNFPNAEFVKVDDETMEMFQEASCQKERTLICSFPSNYVLYGSFTGTNKTEAIMLSGVPGDGPYIPQGELFSFAENSWRQLGPFENKNYSFFMGNKCRKIVSSSGHNLLLCTNDFAGSYDKFVDPEFFPMYTLRLLDFSKIPLNTILFSTRDMANNSLLCMDLQPNEAFKLLDDVQMTFNDFNNDEISDITLNLRETEVSSSQCAIFENEGGGMKLGGKTPVLHELIWLFDGETFTPTLETQLFLDNMR